MSTRVDSTLIKELKEYGAINPEACINCGNCTAICPLTTSEHPFVRRTIRSVQMGLRDRLVASIDPWLCYFCGDCSITCPRGAEPAETMMATRRWLIAQYDMSGKAKKLYTSEKHVAFTIFRTSLLPLVLLIAYHIITGGSKIATDRVVLNDFAPVMWVWAIVLLHFAILGWHLVRNSLNMIRNVLGPNANLASIPLGAYVAGAKDFVIHFFSQRQWWSKCDPEERKVEISRWFKHMLLMSGYGIMLILIVPLLWWFQTDEFYPIYHPQRWLGYYATVILIYTSVEILLSRRAKKEEIHRFSHPTDWLFPSFLLVAAVTGILVHIFRYMSLPWPTYIIYTIHVMAMVAMLDTEVGIGKWTHLVYRPLALSLDAMKRKAQELAEALAPAD
ncbi:MAG: 4Fe-4S dicluster domain-containing protein [Anaerolineales bacterium]|nr:4Fe-4S dicluster domain-containing protein [Anaerolineales bacterium]